jgi:hypothetical protein
MQNRNTMKENKKGEMKPREFNKSTDKKSNHANLFDYNFSVLEEQINKLSFYLFFH